MGLASGPGAAVGLLFGLAEIALASVVIGGVQYHLTSYNIWLPDLGQWFELECLLGTNMEEDDLCTYAYWLGGVSLVVTVLLMAMGGGVSGNVLGATCTTVLAFAMFVWWLIGAAILTHNILDVKDDNSYENDWRNAVMGCSWAIMCLFFFHMFAGCALAGLAHKKRKEAKEPKDAEKAAVPPPMTSAPVPIPAPAPAAPTYP